MSGSPIINLINFKVIGVHKGRSEKKNINYGTFIKGPIDAFNKKFYVNQTNPMTIKIPFEEFNQNFNKNNCDKKDKLEDDLIKARFSGNQFIIVKIYSNGTEEPDYIINDGNLDEELYVDPKEFTELNDNNTDMYIDGKLVKFTRYLKNEKEGLREVKYVFDHKLTRLSYMFFACFTVRSVKFVNLILL